VFFKIGCFTFGGGYAMIPLIEREIVNNKKWIKEEEIVDIFAVSQAVPGAIAINSSTFVGYKIAGYKGSLAATMGVVLPSFGIITIIAAFLSAFQENPVVQAAFMGIRSAVVALILVAVIRMTQTSVKDILTALIAFLTVILILVLNIHPVITIVLGGLVGVVIFAFFPEKSKRIMKGANENHDIY